MAFKELRKQSGMSQKRFCEYFEIPLRTVQRWESGDRECPSYLLKLIKYKLGNEGFPKEQLNKPTMTFTEMLEK